MHYNPYVDPCKQYDYVEIGGVKWATKNVGACNITDTGLYFQWGDTQGYTAEQVGEGEGQKYFDWADYKYGNGTSSPGETGMTKYNSTDGKTKLDLEDDAARANWGGSWRMPTDAEFQALIDATTNAWTSITVDNVTVNGRLFTDKEDNSKTLFFPAPGCSHYGSIIDNKTTGYYYSSSLSSDVTNSRFLNFNNKALGLFNNPRYRGFSVRGVVG